LKCASLSEGIKCTISLKLTVENACGSSSFRNNSTYCWFLVVANLLSNSAGASIAKATWNRLHMKISITCHCWLYLYWFQCSVQVIALNGLCIGAVPYKQSFK